MSNDDPEIFEVLLNLVNEKVKDPVVRDEIIEAARKFMQDIMKEANEIVEQGYAEAYKMMQKNKKS